jgi:hypothetical protein
MASAPKPGELAKEEALACLGGLVLAEMLLHEQIVELVRRCWVAGVDRRRLARVLGVSRATRYCSVADLRV